MSNQVKVSVPKMDTNGDKLHAETDKIPLFIHELDDAMKKLGTCWEGPAWITFQNQMQSDILYMLDLYDWFRKYLNAISEAEKIYGDSEKHSYECVDRVKI